mmetsp:Transcript_2020/g.6746  ORF Transcript_2020/g.6746 Transcript_2020/m.6746 type:complete len:300 (-) Transcript_2020:68-967(-)
MAVLLSLALLLPGAVAGAQRSAQIRDGQKAELVPMLANGPSDGHGRERRMQDLAGRPPLHWAARGEAKGTKRCSKQQSRGRFTFSSLLAGVSIGVLVTLPAAAVAIDRLAPLPPMVKTPPQEDPKEADATADVESLHLFWPRCISLVFTLLIQSISSFILSYFNRLIATHPSIILFLTTIVGLGGNAGCQSTVLTVRRLALGQSVSLLEQTIVGLLLSLIIGPLLLVRTLLQHARLRTSICIVLSSMVITVVATTLGCGFPKLLWRLGMDPAHSASIIQVCMDILGILIVCLFGVVLLT